MFVALHIQHAMLTRHIVICGLSGCTYFSTLSHKRQDFLKKDVTEHKMCVLIVSTILAETFLILSRPERDMIKNVYWSSCTVPVTRYPCQSLMKPEFSRQIFSIYLNIKYHAYPSSGSRVPCRQT